MRYALLCLLSVVLFSNRTDAQSAKKIVADKSVTEVSYKMVHPLHEWTGTSKEVNCIMLYNLSENKINGVAVSILLSTFDSKNSNRDSHALEVLDGIKYPTVKFVSNDVQQRGNEITIAGNLTFHNVTKAIIIKAQRKDDINRLTVAGTFDVNITHYKVETPSLMGFKTDENMKMNFSVVFTLPPLSADKEK
jgi:polyisoprenoid-binding protein YceI